MELVKTLPQQEPKPAASSEQPEIHDRILDAYFGKMGDQFMLDTQKRIHWICGKVMGPRVLDIGCSQGIAPVLLGREGCQVTGIDADPQAIAAAEAFLASQPEGVQKNVKFLNADFVAHPFNGELFDTVILSEVLEHLVNPASFVALAAERLEAGGRLVVTVPFGINDFIDHKHTYYLLEPLRLAWERFSVDEVELFGKWVGFSFTKRQKIVRDELKDWPWSLIEQMETAFHSAERALLTQHRSLNVKLDDVNKKYRVSNEQVSKMKSQLDGLPQLEQSLVAKENQIKISEDLLCKMRSEVEEKRAKLDEANLKYRVLIDQGAALRERIAQTNAELVKSKQDVQMEQAKRHVGEIELSKLQEQLAHQQVQSAELRTVLNETNLKHRDVTEQMTSLRERIAQADTELAKSRQDVQAEQAKRHVGEIELAKLQEQLTHQQTQSAELRTVLNETNLKHRDVTEQMTSLRERIAQADTELAKSRQDVQAEQAKRHVGEIELAKLQEQLAHQQAQSAELRTVLNETNLKHRDVTEQMTLLRERIAQADTELAKSRQDLQSEQAKRHVGEIELANLQEQLTRQQTQSAELRTVLNETNLKHRDVTEQMTLLRERIAQADAELAKSRQDLQTEQEQRQAREHELTTFQSELQDQLVEFAQQRRRFEQTNAEKEALELDLATTQGALQQAQLKCHSLGNHSELLQRRVEEVEVELSKLLGLHAQSEEKNWVLLAQQEQLLVEQQEWLDLVDEKESTVAILREELAIQNKKLSLLRTDWAEAQQKRDGHYRNLEAEQLKTRDLSVQLGSVRTDLETAQKKMVDLRHMFEDRSAQVARLQRQHDALKVQLVMAKTRHEGWLSFQLGTTMIGATKSLKAAILLPFQIVRIISKHKREKKSRENKNIETLEYYNQARDSEKKIWTQPVSVGTVSDVVAVSVKEVAQPEVGNVPAVAAGRDEVEIQCAELDQKFNTILPFEKTDSPALKKLKVASILDGFTEACFAPECELVRIKPDNWLAALDGQDIDMLLVESAWNGNDGDWLYRVAKYNSPPGNELSDVICWCKEKGIPTVFWNKEDPPNFDRFIERATEFDHIFTTDQNCIPRYRERCHDAKTIEVLMFAAQPSIHNPVLAEKRKDRTFFAGTYYADDFAERRDWMDLLLRSARRFGLDIFDRMYNAAPANKVRYLFPDDLQPNILGCLTYDETLKAYREYLVSLNVNSVFDSPTMFSRRVFELLACGTPVVSTPSLGINNFFGHLVPLVDTAASADAALTQLMNDKDNWIRLSAKGVREIYERHTYNHRMHTICETIDLGTTGLPENESSVVVVVRPSGDAKLFACELTQQRKQPVQEVIIIGSAERDDAVVNHLVALKESGYSAMALPEDNVSSYLHARHRYSVVTFCDSTCHYGPDYVRDAVYSVKYGTQDLATGIRSHFRLANGSLVSDNAAIDAYGLVIRDVHPGSIVMTVASLWESYGSHVSVPKRDYLNRYGFDFFPERVLTESQCLIIDLGE